MQEEVIRFKPAVETGLTKDQVTTRMEEGLNNYDTSVPTKTKKQIMKENIFTLFNILNIIFAIAIFFTGSYQNLTFLGVIFCNTLISTLQELHSKKVIDKLSVVSATKAHVIREGNKEEVFLNEIVLDDIIELNMGNQIITDCIIKKGNIEVNESFITGEADPIFKQEGDSVLSGSFVVSGQSLAQVENVGEDNYTSKISSGAKYIKPLNSQIMNSLNKIVQTVAFVIFPISILLFSKQMTLSNGNLADSIVYTVGALIGMVPEGLILLTSTVLAVSVMRLASKKVLVQELYCIETLARVDVICLDKTGTITEGSMEVVDLISINEDKEKNEMIIKEMFSALTDQNPTALAIKDKYSHKGAWEVKKIENFSSQKKYSGVSFTKEGEYLIGAPEFILKEELNKYQEELSKYQQEYRVIVLVKKGKTNKPLAFLLIQDKIRKSANKTLEYFTNQNVDIKIISGDNKDTVLNIAKKAGIKAKLNAVDATTLDTTSKIEEAVKKYNVFGRVTPMQKKIIVKALKKQGHTVAMTGDGVNDVLALKESDCAIVVASGTDAARNVAQLVLLNSDFDAIPNIVAEGRRTINNIERSAALFLVKTVYAAVLALIFLFVNMPYPFQPVQLSVISVPTIGIPSFILALEPNYELVKGKFMYNVLQKSLPASLTIIANIVLIIILNNFMTFDDIARSTIVVYITCFSSFQLLYMISRPLNKIRISLLITMFLATVGTVIVIPDILAMTYLNIQEWIVFGILAIISFIMYLQFEKLIKHIFNKITN